MTTNQTIDGVPREQIERALDAIEQVGLQDKFIDYTFVRTVKNELRALLDAPQPSEGELIANGLGYPFSKEEALQLWYSGFKTEPITVLEAWDAIGHDIGCNPSKDELLDSLRNMAAICEAHGNDMPAAQPQGQPFAWYTEDYLTDKSATTYDLATMERWKAKGWPVTPMYLNATSPAALLGKGFTTLESGDGKYRIITPYQNRDDAWSDYTALCKAEQPAPVAVAYQYLQRPLWRKDDNSGWMPWQDCSQEAHADYTASPDLHDWQYETRTLYAGPNQQ